MFRRSFKLKKKFFKFNQQTVNRWCRVVGEPTFQSPRKGKNGESDGDGSDGGCDADHPDGTFVGQRTSGNPNVPVQIERAGAAHAEKPQSIQTGGHPARHRLHLRSANGARTEPSEASPANPLRRRRLHLGRRRYTPTAARSTHSERLGRGKLIDSLSRHDEFFEQKSPCIIGCVL